MSKDDNITFSHENLNTKDAAVPLLGEVFWIESFVARHWERFEVYIKALFSSFSIKKKFKLPDPVMVLQR